MWKKISLKSKIKNWIPASAGMTNKKTKKNFWKIFQFKKRKKSFLKFFRKKKFFLRFLKFKKRKNEANKFLVSFLFGLIWALVVLIIFGSVEVEKINTKQKIQSEVDNLSRVVLTEVESDFLDILNRTDWQNLEDKKQLAEKIRHLNYLNAHLQKTINQYYQDWSLKIFNFNKKELDEIFNQVQNIQIISSRITNKIDSSLLFEEISKDQKELIEKDFELFYEKIDLISLAIQLF
jgi:hypothetical protein